MPKRKNKQLRKQLKKQEQLNNWFAQVASEYNDVTYEEDANKVGYNNNNNNNTNITTTGFNTTTASLNGGSHSSNINTNNDNIEKHKLATKYSILFKQNKNNINSEIILFKHYFQILSDIRYCICCISNPLWAYQCHQEILYIVKKLQSQNIMLSDSIVENVTKLNGNLNFLQKKYDNGTSLFNKDKTMTIIMQVDRLYYETYYFYITTYDDGRNNNNNNVLQPIQYLSVYNRSNLTIEMLQKKRMSFFNQLPKQVRKEKASELNYNKKNGTWNSNNNNNNNNPLLQILQHSMDESILFLGGGESNNNNNSSNSNKSVNNVINNGNSSSVYNHNYNSNNNNIDKKKSKKRKKKKRRKKNPDNNQYNDYSNNYIQTNNNNANGDDMIKNNYDNNDASSTTGYGSGARAKPMVSVKIENWRNHQREWPCRLYAFATPNNNVLNRLQEYGPFIEIGAGTGYWASLLLDQQQQQQKDDGNNSDRQQEIIIKPFDKYATKEDGENLYHQETKRFTKVQSGDDNILRNEKYKNHTLFLCYPPPNNNMAYDCLTKFKGKTFAYVGEFEGTTGNLKFEKYLYRNFKLINCIDLPKFPDQNCNLTIWKRRKQEIPSPISKALYLASWPLACDCCGAKGIPGVVKLKRCKISRRAIYCSEKCFHDDRKRYLSQFRICFCMEDVDNYLKNKQNQGGYVGNNVEFVELGLSL